MRKAQDWRENRRCRTGGIGCSRERRLRTGGEEGKGGDGDAELEAR